jgi:RNA polymerase sigma-70 factor (ECF subfamily)
VVVLHVFEGLTFRETAEILGIPQDTAASRYRYALEKLKELLQP